MYAGINGCNTSHKGISVAKLIHAVVCFNDMSFGSGSWQWTYGSADIQMDPNVSVTQAPLMGNQIMPMSQTPPATFTSVQVNYSSTAPTYTVGQAYDQPPTYQFNKLD